MGFGLVSCSCSLSAHGIERTEIFIPCWRLILYHVPGIAIPSESGDVAQFVESGHLPGLLPHLEFFFCGASL